MNTLTQPLRDEHKELYPSVNHILEVADGIGIKDSRWIRQGVEEIYDFLAFHLKPHAEAEEAALYTVVQKALGSPDATRTMSRDHVEVGRYITELAELRSKLSGETVTSVQAQSLRRVLYGVYALLKVHFAKEEEVYLPILDRWLTPESARQMFESMEAAAHQAKHAAQQK